MSDYMKCFWWENCACDGYSNCTEECKSCLYIHDDDYDKYYLEYENEGCAFVFGLEDEVCMIYVSDYDAFGDVEVIGQV